MVRVSARGAKNQGEISVDIAHLPSSFFGVVFIFEVVFTFEVVFIIEVVFISWVVFIFESSFLWLSLSSIGLV